MRTFLLLAGFGIATMLTALSFAGCGGDSTNTVPAKPLTKAAFIKKADFICEAVGLEQLEKAVKYTKQNPKFTRADLTVPAILPPLKGQIQKLKNLAAPSGDAAEVTAYIEELEADLKAAEEEPTSVETAFDPASKLAADYGFADCSVLP